MSDDYGWRFSRIFETPPGSCAALRSFCEKLVDFLFVGLIIQELVKLGVAVDGERAASKLSEGKGFLRDDRRENDAHRIRLVQPLPVRVVQKARVIRRVA